jgi:DNA-binding CsgD family transcriptional regulator
MSATTNLESLLPLIGAFYEAAAEPGLWPRIAIDLTHEFRSESCMLLTSDAHLNTEFLGLTDNLAGGVMDDYRAYYYAQDQWVAGGLRAPNQAIIGHQVAPAEWYKSSEFLNELCVRAGIHDVVGAALTLTPGRTAILGIHRAKHDTAFNEADKARLDVLIPHLKRAIQLTIRLENAGIDHQAALEGLERAHAATILVDARGAILFATRLAETLLRRGEGLRAVNGRLACAERRAADRLACLIRGATGVGVGPVGSPCGAVAIERDDGRPPLTILVAPFRPKRPAFGSPVPAALVFIRDPEAPTMATDILRDLFGLTPAQAAVAARLGGGECLEDVAAALHITRYTAQDHLKAIFAKTGCCRQPQLVALLSRGVAAMGVGDGAGRVVPRGDGG